MTLHWVPENIGVEENEKTDELARKVSSTSLVGPKLFCGLEDAFFKEELRRVIAAKRDRLWRDAEGLRQTKKRFGG